MSLKRSRGNKKNRRNSELLAQMTDADQRRALLRLLAEEKAKAPLSKAQNDD